MHCTVSLRLEQITAMGLELESALYLGAFPLCCCARCSMPRVPVFLIPHLKRADQPFLYSMPDGIMRAAFRHKSSTRPPDGWADEVSFVIGRGL